MDRNEILDKFLEFFRNQHKNKVIPLDVGLTHFCDTIGVDYRSESGDYTDTLVENNIVIEKPSGIFPATKFHTFKGFINMQMEELRLGVLENIESSYISGKSTDISEFLLMNCPDLNSKSLYQMLEAMVNQELISGNFGIFRNNPNSTVSKVINAGNTFFAKIEKPGYSVLNPSVHQSGSVYNVNGGTPMFLTNSNNNTFNFKDSLNKEDISKALPELINFFNTIRSDDAAMLLEAYKSDQNGQDIKSLDYDRIVSFLASITTIATPFLPK
jgi:hypothetical protein